MELIWTQEARRRIKNIYHYLAVKEKMPEVAKAVTKRIINRTPKILDMPLAGKKVSDYDDEKIREVQEKPYRLIYYVTENIVYILSVMHSRQLLPHYDHMMGSIEVMNKE